MTTRNQSLLTAAALFAFTQTGCGGDNPAGVPRQPGMDRSGPSNSPPVIKGIPDATLEYGDSTTVTVRIEDQDPDDSHTLSADCEDQGVARSSVEDGTITITAWGLGATTCSVYATDSSGQDNARSAAVTFRVTVTEPPVDLGACQVGLRVRPGESCSYPAGPYQVRFSVKPDGSSCRKSDKPITKEVFGSQVTIRGLGDVCVYHDIRGDDVFDTDFSADQDPDGSWTVREVPCQIPPLDKGFNGIPVVFRRSDNTSVLLSDGGLVVFASGTRESPLSLVIGGPVRTSRKATVEFAGGDLLDRDGARTPDGELTEFEVGDTFEGSLELSEDLSALRVDVPAQDGTTIRGSNVLRGLRVSGTETVVCPPGSEEPVAGALTQLAEDLLDIMRHRR